MISISSLMASKHIFSSLPLLLLFTSSFYSPVHARDSKFFTKTASPEYAPAPAPGPATASTPMQPENSYGLYGDSNTVTSRKELTNNYENEVTLTETYNNNIDEETMREDNSSEKDSSEIPNDDFYSENGYYDNYKSSVTITNSNNEGQGMSDTTKYIESGKYYYDIKSDDLTNENNGYSATSGELIDPEVYGSSNEFNAMEEYYQNSKEQEYVP